MLQQNRNLAALLIALALLVAAPARGEILFQDDFEDQPDWDGVPDPPSVGGICTGSDCNNMPVGWSFYLTKGCDSGHCSLTIQNGPANDGANAKSLYYWLDAHSGTGWSNDAQLNKFFANNRPGYPDLWVQFEMRVDPTWEFQHASGGSPQMKLGRTGNYMGDGTLNGPEGHSVWPWPSNINDKSHRPWSYYGVQRAGGGDATVAHYLTPKCDSYDLCPGETQNAKLRYFWNYPPAYYCDGSPEDSAEQCLKPNSLNYTSAYGDARCADGTCSGAKVEGSSVSDPADYGNSGGAYCSSPDQGCDVMFDYDSPGAWGDGQWHTWRYHMHMNSALGVADGWLKVWLDGVLIHNFNHVPWKTAGFMSNCDGTGGPAGDGCPDYEPMGWNYFGFGGNNFRVHDRAGYEQWYAIDNVVMATSEADLGQAGVPACADGTDNDQDGLTDVQDPGCSGSEDTSETNSAVACDDAADNDGDGLVDYRAAGGDPGCSSLTDTDENNCGNGSIEAGEACDGAQLGGQTCASLGYDAGTLACSAQCTFDTGGCEAACHEIPSKAGWTASADSYEASTSWLTPPSQAIDENPSSFWLTEWVNNDAPLPHRIDIDLGATRNLCGLSYLPRQASPVENGVIQDYEIYVSSDGVLWSLVDDSESSGPLFQSPYSLATEPAVRRFVTVPARHVRLLALSEINGNPWSSAAEVGIFEDTSTGQAGDPPPAVENVIRTDVDPQQ